MVKDGAIFTTYGIVAITGVAIPEYLSIPQQWHLYVGLVRMSITILAAIFLFKSVWVRGGYEGPNKILELHEVDKLVAHIIGFFCLLELQYMDTMEPLINYTYPDYRYWLFGSGFLGSGLYLLVDYLRKFKKDKE